MSSSNDKSKKARRSSDVLSTLQCTHSESKSAVNTELQRVSHIFQGTSPISEAEFVINCKSVMNLLQYSRAEVEPHHLALLVEVIENAIFTFVLRVLPAVFQQLIAPTSLLHPISPPMIFSLLEVVDAYVSQYGNYVLQLRMAAARLLLQDNEDVALAVSLCQMLPRIQPNIRWQPVMNPIKAIKANPVSNIHGSISLPEIHPPVLPDSPSVSQDGTSLFGSPIPSLSSLLNCTTSSSASLPRVHLYDPKHVNIITESVSQPTLPVTAGPSLAHSFSAPNLQNIPTPSPSSEPIPVMIPPIIASEGIILSDFSSREILFSTTLSSPGRSANDQQTTTTHDDKNVLPDIHVELAPTEDDLPQPSSDGIPLPPVSSFTSQDDLSRFIACSDVGEEPPSPSLFSPDPNAATDLSLSIGLPPSGADLPVSKPSSEHIPLSPLSNQISSPLSSPRQIIVREDQDIFRNTFELEVQKRPPSPYNKRLRSASNNPQPTMKRAEPNKRAVSASVRKTQLDPDLAALTLPPPPNPKTVILADALRRTTRAKRPKTPSLPRRGNPIVIDDENSEPAPPKQRSTSTSINKENE